MSQIWSGEKNDNNFIEAMRRDGRTPSYIVDAVEHRLAQYSSRLKGEDGNCGCTLVPYSGDLSGTRLQMCRKHYEDALRSEKRNRTTPY